MKGIQVRGEEVRLPLFLDSVIVCVDNCQKSTKKLSEVISEFSKSLGSKATVIQGQR